MRLNVELLEKIVKLNDPIPPVIETLLSFASKGYQAVNDISELERLICSAAPELYLNLFDFSKKLKLVNRAREENATLIVLDGASLLELSSIRKGVIEAGYTAKNGWSLSSIPSVSKTFIEREFGLSVEPSILPQKAKKIGLKVEYLKDEKTAKALSPSEADCVWIREPDDTIHENVEFEDISEKVFLSVRRILDSLRPSKAIITSDHGYVPTGYWGIERRISKRLSDRLIHYRYVEKELFPGELLFKSPYLAYHIEHEGYAILRGWWTPKKKRKMPLGVHGGASLLEQVTPMVEASIKG